MGASETVSIYVPHVAHAGKSCAVLHLGYSGWMEEGGVEMCCYTSCQCFYSRFVFSSIRETACNKTPVCLSIAAFRNGCIKVTVTGPRQQHVFCHTKMQHTEIPAFAILVRSDIFNHTPSSLSMSLRLLCVPVSLFPPVPFHTYAHAHWHKG